MCLLVIPFISTVLNIFIHLPGNTSSAQMLIFMRTDPSFSLAIFKGRVSEEPNCTLEFVEPTPSIVSDSDPHSIVLPTNQVPWKMYYRKDLISKIGSPTSQLAPVTDSEPPRD